MSNNKCENCLWSQVVDVAPFCVQAQATNRGCDFFLPKNKAPIPTYDKKEEECSTCKKKKDVGSKCWWCGN